MAGLISRLESKRILKGYAREREREKKVLLIVKNYHSFVNVSLFKQTFIVSVLVQAEMTQS